MLLVIGSQNGKIKNSKAENKIGLYDLGNRNEVIRNDQVLLPIISLLLNN